MTLPCVSVMEIMVLLNVARMWATPEVILIATRRFFVTLDLRFSLATM